MKTIKITPINELFVREYFDLRQKGNKREVVKLNLLLDEELLLSLKMIAVKLSCPIGQIISSIAECLAKDEEILKEINNEEN